jgi:FK506-binding protein 2
MNLFRSFRLTFLVLVAVSFLAASLVSAAGGKGVDLDAGAKLRIGVKHRPDECQVKSKKGDKVSMHYTGSLYKVSICS